MPMIPEAAIAMLACTRIGAVHCVVFGGFSIDPWQVVLKTVRQNWSLLPIKACVVEKLIPLKENVDAALQIAGTESVQKMIVVHRTGHPITMKEDRDLWSHGNYDRDGYLSC